MRKDFCYTETELLNFTTTLPSPKLKIISARIESNYSICLEIFQWTSG